jgi:hypothetical protein
MLIEYFFDQRPMLLASGYGPDQLPVTRASVPCYENLFEAARAIVEAPYFR